MDKHRLVVALIEQLEKDLLIVKEAARATYEAATHEESKPENEYDTRGLEASYLAGAQAKRAGEIDEVLSLFRYFEFKSFTQKSPVSSSALVEVEHLGKMNFVFLMPKGGGISLSLDGTPVQVITPSSLLGEALLGLHVDDVAEVEVGDQVREYRICSIR